MCVCVVLLREVCLVAQLKKVHWRASCHVLNVKPVWAISIGQGSSAVAGAGSPLPFKSIKAELIPAPSSVYFFWQKG